MDELTDPLIATVDSDDQITGYQLKSLVHKKGVLHRAFSIFIFNSDGQLLLQQRASDKYHSPGLWTNTCCSHLNHNEDMVTSVNKRLMNEMGIETKLTDIFSFTYKIAFENNLIEHETDHVYIGIWDGIPCLNPNEADAYKWISLDVLEVDVNLNPSQYTYWLKHIVNNHLAQLKSALTHGSSRVK
jgi:isopentenyl-diphosphate Delta-isomerase